MPRHVDELRDGEPFPVKPETNEYKALSFLVGHREYGFTPKEIADRTTVSEASVSKTMARLFEKGLVERTRGMYYVDPDRAEDLKRRLDSIDAAARLHEITPDDDVYAETGWEEEVSSIDPGRGRRFGGTDDESDTASEAEELVTRLADEDPEGDGERDGK